MQRPGWFVGVGIDSYAAHQPLEHAVAEVSAVARALGAEFVGDPLCNPDEAAVREHLKTVPGCLDSGALVQLWCGHGVQSGTKLWLQTRDAGGRINAADVVDRCAQSGAAQLLFIVDTCQAGAGLAEAGAVASALLEDWTSDDQRPDFLRRGSAWYMLPNPLWDPGAPTLLLACVLRFVCAVLIAFSWRHPEPGQLIPESAVSGTACQSALCPRSGLNRAPPQA